MRSSTTTRPACRAVLSLLLLLSVSPSVRPSVQAQARPKDPLAGLDAWLDNARTTFKVPGLAIAIVKGDSVIYAKGFGVRKVGEAATVDANTIFAIGSSSKAFTAAALGILVDEGKVKWDDPVTTYLPEFEMYDPYASKEMRVRDLVTHRSGLQRGDALWYGSILPREEILRRIRFLKPTWSIRTRFGYQNLMFLTAGQISARIEGKSWDEVIRSRFFGPLQMTHATTSTTPLAGMDNVASPHAEIRDTVRPVPWRNIDNIGPAGSINASAREMANWVKLWLDSGRYQGKQILSPASWAEATKPQFVINDPAWHVLWKPVGDDFLTYGFGWIVREYRGHKVVDHGGNIDGMSAEVAFAPQDGIGLVILTNMNGSELREAVTAEVLDRLLGLPPHDWVTDVKKMTDGLQAQGRAAQAKREADRAKDTHPTLPLSAYAGVYTDSLYGELTVRDEGGGLTLTLGLRPSIVNRLEHWQYDSFRSMSPEPVGGGPMTNFQLGSDGKVKAVELEGLSVFTRKPDKAP